jgi:hypothetical protein
MTTIDQQCAALFTGGDTSLVGAELRVIIENAITNQPRSLQTTIGPSELGIDCVRCLISKLGGIPEARDVAWLPFVGTAVHAELDRILVDYEVNLANHGHPGRYLSETRVSVGTVAGTEITGSCDLFDIATGTVVDYKVVGATTLRDAKANGPSTIYRRQINLYGKGFEDAGYTVTTVAVFYLPRNEPSLANAHFWSEPYDRAVAQAAIDRADMYANVLAVLGLDQVLDDAPPHTGGFSCNRYDPSVAKPGHRPRKDLKGLIAS